MATIQETPVNQRKQAQVLAALEEMLSEVLKRGFYGKASVELNIHDGTIQHIYRKVKRIER